MEAKDYLAYIVNEIHTTIVATVDDEGLPVTAAIDMMDSDDNSLYFLTAKGKGLDSVGVGQNVTEGIAEGMTAAGWDTTAETLATNLETAINSAFIINSPSERMKPAGEYVAAGIGAGTTVSSNVKSALQQPDCYETEIHRHKRHGWPEGGH